MSAFRYVERVMGIALPVVQLYLFVTGRWRPIVWFFLFSGMASLLVNVVNIPMGTYWILFDYPDGLTIPGLRFLVKPWRLRLLMRLPQIVYGALAYGLGIAAFLLFGQSGSASERVWFMVLASSAAFAPLLVFARLLQMQDDTRGLFLMAQARYAGLAFVVLTIVNAVAPLRFIAASILLGAVTLVIAALVERAAVRIAPVTLVSGYD
jgi:hypothetical protein